MPFFGKLLFLGGLLSKRTCFGALSVWHNYGGLGRGVGPKLFHSAWFPIPCPLVSLSAKAAEALKDSMTHERRS